MNFPTRLAAGMFAVSLLVVGIDGALASPKTLADAKKAGFPTTSCQYCHTEALPKKETFTPASLNERGKFLLEDEQKRNLKAPDPAALKNYSGGADKK